MRYGCSWYFRRLGSLGLTVAFTLSGHAARAEERVRHGFYVGFAAATEEIGGGFNGDSIFHTSSEVFLVPAVDRSTALGAVAGFRGQAAAFEASYVRSLHDVTFQQAQGQASYNCINLDGKFFLGPRSRIEPYVLAGVAFPWLVVEDGAAERDGDQVRSGDARFSGVGINLGGGLAAHLHPRLTIAAGPVYHLVWYTHVKGVAKDGADLEKTLGGNGLSVGGVVTFSF